MIPALRGAEEGAGEIACGNWRGWTGGTRDTRPMATSTERPLKALHEGDNVSANGYDFASGAIE